MRLENAVREPQAAHVAILGRRHVEQAVEPPAKVVRRFRWAICGSLRFETLVAIEGVLLPLPPLGVRKLLALGFEARHGLEMSRLGPDRCGGAVRLGGTARGLQDAQPRD